MISVTFVSERNSFEWKASVLSVPQVGDTVYMQPRGVKIGSAPGESSYDWTVKRVAHIVTDGDGRGMMPQPHTIRIIVG